MTSEGANAVSFDFLSPADDENCERFSKFLGELRTEHLQILDEHDVEVAYSRRHSWLVTLMQVAIGLKTSDQAWEAFKHPQLWIGKPPRDEHRPDALRWLLKRLLGIGCRQNQHLQKLARTYASAIDEIKRRGCAVSPFSTTLHLAKRSAQRQGHSPSGKIIFVGVSDEILAVLQGKLIGDLVDFRVQVISKNRRHTKCGLIGVRDVGRKRPTRH